MTQLEVLAHERPVPRSTAPAVVFDHTSEVGDLWHILLRQHRMIAAITLALVFAAGLYCLVIPSLYTATSQILVDPRERQIVANDPNPSALAPDGGIAQVESQTRVIESSSVLLRAIAAVDLVHDPEFGADHSGLMSRLRALLGFGSPPAVGADAQDETLRALKKRLAVKRADKVFVIDIVVTAQSGAKAARLANAIADAYLADQSEARADAARRDSDALTARLAQLRQRVNEAEQKVESYKADKDIVDASGRLIDEQQLTDVNAQLAVAQTRVTELKARVDQIDRMRKGSVSVDSIAEAIQSPVISRLRQQYAELVAREADLRTQFGDRHPALIAVQAQLHNVGQLIAAELDRIGRSAHADYDRARDGLRMLKANVDVLKQTSLSTGEASIKLRELQREAEASRAVYASFLGRSQETREQATIDLTNARVITRAAAPPEKSWPPTLYLLLGALVSGLTVGSGTALTREYLAPTVLTREQLQHLCDGAPCIGQLTIAAESGWLQLAGRIPSLATDDAVAQAMSRLFDLSRPRRDLRTILVVSGLRDEATTARALTLLAHAASAQGLQVLIVDMRVATDAPAPARTADGSLTLGQLMMADVDSEVFRLGLPPGVLGTSRHESTIAFQRLLADALHSFDLVFVHGGTVGSNVRFGSIAPLVGEVVLMARLGVTRQSDLVDTVEATSQAGIPVSATLLLDG
jgi:polysaccharide biosynthesis transport protein